MDEDERTSNSFSPRLRPLPGAGHRRSWAIWFVVLNVIWLWLISSFVLAEAVLGLVASAVAATAAVAVATSSPVGYRTRLEWLLLARRLPMRTLRESAMVLSALGRQIAGRGAVGGRFRIVQVELPEDPSESTAKRALLIAGESLAPNSYVLGINEETGAMLIHELVEVPEP